MLTQSPDVSCSKNPAQTSIKDACGAEPIIHRSQIIIIGAPSQKKRDKIQFAQTSLFHSNRTIFTKAENVTMGTHYQATSVAWHDAQQLLGHCCQWLLVSVDQFAWMRECVLWAGNSTYAF